MIPFEELGLREGEHYCLVVIDGEPVLVPRRHMPPPAESPKGYARITRIGPCRLVLNEDPWIVWLDEDDEYTLTSRPHEC